MRLRSPVRDESGERGAIAIMIALLVVVLLGVVALGVDTSLLVNQRQMLNDTIDAAAQAGAYRIPDGPTAKADAVTFTKKNDPDPVWVATPPTVDLFCVVASKASGSTWVVDTSQIPATCNPASVKSGNSYTGYKCNAVICSIPCPAVGDVCNTVKVTGTKAVPYTFAPVIGINKGSTGSVSSAACKGSCGTTSPNPMDVAVVADHTGSMDSDDINDMITGIKGMFQVMTPSLQYVALGTIGWSSSSAPSSCKSSPNSTNPTSSSTSAGWMPVPFSTDYLTAGTTTINTSSVLVQAVNCLTTKSGTGTHLAQPMKAAARYLLGTDPNNLTSLPARTGTVRKAIIFETDGQPEEKFTGGLPALSSAPGIGSTANNDTACTNLKNVATNAKAAGILVVTVAFNVSGTKCSGAGGSAKVVDTLAAAASPNAAGAVSAANYDCSTTAGRGSENADGDSFFCAAPGDAMAPIFKTAFGQLSGGIRLVQLPL